MSQPSWLRSFGHAWRGLLVCFRSERSFRFQVAAALVVTAAMFVFPLTRNERLILLVVIASVLVLELLNSSVERLVDIFKPRLDEYAKEVKDLMAGAVLLASLFALVIGALIFVPPIWTSLTLLAL
jgi:diacylglycerol kinase